MSALIIFVKAPVPGSVKTRLGKEIGDKAAADLYTLFIQQTVETVKKTSCHPIHIAYTPFDAMNAVRKVIHGDFIYFPQRGDHLGERLTRAFEYALTTSDKTIIIGSDSPTLPPSYIDQAISRLDSSELVLGPSEDGGYYLVGLRGSTPQIFSGVTWSSSSVLQQSIENAQHLNISYELLPQWYDIDDLLGLKRAIGDDKSGRIEAYLKDQAISS